jgi:hypothetical protein
VKLGLRFEGVSLGIANVCSLVPIRNIYNFNTHFHLQCRFRLREENISTPEFFNIMNSGKRKKNADVLYV